MSDTRNLAKKHKEETLMAESCKRIKESTMLTTVPLLPSTLTILQAMAIPPSPLPPKFGERILAHTSAFSGVAKLPSSYVLYACHVMDDGIGDAQHLIDFAKYHESIPAFSLYKPLIMIRFGKVNQANIENMLRDQGYKIHSDNIHLICIDNIMLETPTKLTSMAVRIIEGFWLNEHDYKCLLQCAQFFHCCSGDNSFEHAISCGAIPIYQIKLFKLDFIVTFRNFIESMYPEGKETVLQFFKALINELEADNKDKERACTNLAKTLTPQLQKEWDGVREYLLEHWNTYKKMPEYAIELLSRAKAY